MPFEISEADVELLRIDSQTDLESEIGIQLLSLCQVAASSDLSSAQNMSDLNWQERPETLLYCIYVEKRFDQDRGYFWGLKYKKRLIAVSGVYRSTFNPEQISIAGVRTYTHPEYRNFFWHGQYLIPEQIEWSKKNELSLVLLTFNDSSQSLLHFLRRIRTQRATVFGHKIPEIYKKFIEHPQKLVIKNTAQHVLKLYLKPNFSCEFKDIEVI